MAHSLVGGRAYSVNRMIDDVADAMVRAAFGSRRVDGGAVGAA
ncbi:hypothetical protein [Streptomyces goshikiensis]